MRAWLRTFLLLIVFLFAHAAPVVAQDKGPPEKSEPPAKYERDGTTMLVHYLIAGIAALLIMVLICMPVRRD